MGKHYALKRAQAYKQAGRTLDLYGEITGTEEASELVTDLLADLMHFCKMHRELDFGACLSRAKVHFQQEQD
jgi:hypothetical protein